MWFPLQFFFFFIQSINELRQNVTSDHSKLKKDEFDKGPQSSYGYGGKFGVEKDRMDKVQYHNFFLSAA